MSLPRHVKLVEIGPRDGLRNGAQRLSTAVMIELIERLTAAGLSAIAAPAFISPPGTPQLADPAEVLRGLRRWAGVTYPVLTPNLKRFDAAVEAGATEVAIALTASESFSRQHGDGSIAESLKRIEPVTAAATALDIAVRAHVSCVVGCPYEGAVAPEQAAAVAKALFEMGCHEISLGDTLGIGTPASIARLIESCARAVPIAKLAGDYHDTCGMAVANIYASLQLGMSAFDCAVAGLGGSGNVASEDVVYLLHGLDIETGIDLDALAGVGAWISDVLQGPNGTKAGRALCARRG